MSNANVVIVDTITPDEVSALLLNPSMSVGQDYLVIDVRGDDYHTGNIRGCKNIPSNIFLDDVEGFANKLDNVHCEIHVKEYYVVRGPKCANRYASTRNSSASVSSSQRVSVLQGGFYAFQEKFKTDSRLVDNFNQEYWNDPY